MAAYSFLTTWCFDAPIEQVWELIHDSERYPEWWKGVTGVVELDPGDENGVGNRSTFSWRSALPYTLAFDLEITRVEAPHVIEAHATGELDGVGIWRLFSAPQGTAVLYSWDVDTTRPWMRWLEPIARPAFKWNHDLVMRQGAEGLAARLGVPLIACD